jgi:PKD repeat protein
MQRARRALLAGALALVSAPFVTSSVAEAAAVEPETCPDGSFPCVTLRVVGTSDDEEKFSHFLLTGNGDSAVSGKEYSVRSKASGPTTTLTVDKGWSISTVTGGQSASFSETDNPDKFPAVLDAGEFNGSFKDNLLPAIYVTADNRIGYVRPLRSAADVNGDEVFTLPANQPLTLTLHTKGEILDVQFDTTPSKITTDTPVSFTAKVTPNSDKLRYSWNFTGGTKTEDKSAAPTHTYAKKGTYSVNLQVRDDDGSYGRAATTSVKVGSPPRPTPTPTTGTGGSGGGGGGGSGGGGGGGGGYVPPYIPNDTSTPPLGDAPLSDLPDLPTAPTDDGLQEVEGFVLAGAGAETGDSIPGVEVASQPTKASELSNSRKISGAVIGGLAVILLLGLGAEIEARWVSTRLGHLRRRI